MQLKFFQVLALPGVLQPNALYFVLNGGYTETYLTSSQAVAKAVGNSAMINALITAALGTFSTLVHVATIAARDTAAGNAQNNTIYLVTDATGDATVKTGAALYFYDKAAGTQTKVAEYESMDVVVQWGSINGRPNSTAAAIDQAVGNSHTHANMSTLNGLSDNAGQLYYGGKPVNGADWAATDW